MPFEMNSDSPNSDISESAPSIWMMLTRELISAAFAVFGVYVTAKVVKRVMDPNAEARERTRQRREEVVSRLLRTGVPLDSLKYMAPAEETLLHDLVFPEDISACFDSVGGLSGTKEMLKELIVYPLQYPDVYQTGGSSLLQPPKGILLYGPPGTGKTMLAKALAKESGANFLALSPSSLLSKWLGDTEQLARAVFSLAQRVQPTIIFIDEIDGLFRERSSSEHEAHKNLKAEFMQLWDGLTTDERHNQVVVLGATNRPYDVDPAILRRMPRPFEVALPTETERVEILQKVLSGVQLERGFDHGVIAQATDMYSGSDLKELCRAAMMQPIRESVREAARNRMSVGRQNSSKKLRPLRLQDVLEARRTVSRTQDESAEYGIRVRTEASQSDPQMDVAMRLLQTFAGRSS